MKINVVGTSGSGKSTVARQVAEKLSIPYIELDQLFWGPGWTETPDEEFFAKLRAALAQNSWVLDGNYSRTTPIKWKEVDMVVWLDFTFPRTVFQACKRALYRAITRRELWPKTGNKENLRQLFSNDSIVLWTVKTYKKNRRKYLAMMADEQYASITFVRLKSPQEVRDFLATLSS